MSYDMNEKIQQRWDYFRKARIDNSKYFRMGYHELQRQIRFNKR